MSKIVTSIPSGAISWAARKNPELNEAFQRMPDIAKTRRSLVQLTGEVMVVFHSPSFGLSNNFILIWQTIPA